MSLAWGGHSNGRIPNDRLVPVGVSPALVTEQYLEAEAASHYFALNQEFRARFGKDLAVTEGYRNLERQNMFWGEWLAYKHVVAAYPGTSNHGWGRACDFGSGAATASSAESRWLRANASRHGFRPTGFGFARVEPWHYDYQPGTATLAGTTGTQIEETDDMFDAAAEARIMAAIKAARPRFEFAQSPDGTVWLSYNRIIRYGIPSPRNLSTYQAHLAALGYTDLPIVAKSWDDITAYGTPVYADPLSLIAHAVDGTIEDEAILATVESGTVTLSEAQVEQFGAAFGERYGIEITSAIESAKTILAEQIAAVPQAVRDELIRPES